MSSHRQQHYILENPETPVTASSVQRSALMDYDDIKFINEDIQEIDRDHFHLDTEVRHMGLSRFSIDEPLEVQLRFDGLDETQILLDEHSPSDERWGSGFSRQDNGALGLETTSPNIAFSSSGTNAFKTGSLLRHTNVWSEATSSESVQMLLNSIRQDEINMTTEASLFEGSDFGELIGSSHDQMELNTWSGSKSTKRDSSPLRLQDVSEVGFETMDEKIHPGFEQSAMDTTEHNRRSPTMWNDSEDNGEAHGSSMLVGNVFSVMDCRLEANKHVSVIGDPFEGNKLEQDISKHACNSLQHTDAVQYLNVESKRVRKEIAGCQFKVVEQTGDEMGPNCVGALEAEEMISQNLTEAGDKIEGKISELLNTRGRLDNEGREYTTMVQSCCEVIAEFEQAEIQSMPDSLLEESNEDSPGKHVTEASQEDIVPSGMQGSSETSFHESDENNAYRLDTEAPQDDVMIVQGMANPIMDEESEGTAIGSNWTQMGKRREGQAPVFPRSGGSFNNEVRGSATLAESCYMASTGFGRAEIQGMSGSSLSVNNEDAVENHMTKASRDDAARELKGIPELLLDESNEKGAKEDYDGVELKVRREPMLDESNLKNTQKHDLVGSMGDAVLADVQEMPESYFGTHSMDNMRVHAAGASQQCVVLAKTHRMADPFMGEKEGICVGSHSLLDAGNNREAKMTKSPKSRESLDSEEGEDAVMRGVTTMVVSFHEVRAGFGREENEEMSDSTLDEINSDSAGKCVTESSPQDLFLVETSVSESSSDKKKEKSVGRIGTVTSEDDGVPLDVEGLPQSVFEVSNEDDTGMHTAKAYCDDAVKKRMRVADPFFNDKEGMGGSNQNWMELGDKREGGISELASEERLDYRVREYATVIGSSHQMGAGCGLAEMQVMSDSILDETRKDNARENTTEALQGNEMQVILSLSLDGSAENVVGKHVAVRSDEDAVMDMHGMSGSLPNVVDKNAEEHSTEASQSDTVLAEMQEVPDPSPDDDNDGGGFVGASQDDVSRTQIQEMSNSLLYEGNQSNTQKCAAEASKEDVVHVERQAILEPILNEINEDNGEKHATEASLENAREGEQRMLCTDYEHSVSITSVQPENPLDNLAGVLTKENPLSGVLNEDNAQKHATEASQKTDLGEQSVLATNYEQSADNSSELLGNCVENVVDVLTADKFQMDIQGDALQQNSVLLKELDEGLAGFKKGPECDLEYFAREEKSLAGSKDFSSIDVEVRQDTNDDSRNQQTSRDIWVRDSEVISRQIPTDVQLRDSEAMPTSLSLGEGISSSLLTPPIAKTPETMSSTEGEKSMAFTEQAEMISLDHGACHTGTHDIVASEVQEAKGASQLQVSVVTTSVNNTSSLNGNITEVDEAAVNCEYGEPFSAIQKRKGDEDADPPKLKKTLHEKLLPLVSASCVAGSSDSTTEMISMDTVPCYLGTDEIIASEAQETKSVSKLQVDVPPAPVSVGIALVNAMSKTENMTEADEATTSCEYGDPSSAIQNHMVDEDVDLSPKQTRKLHRKRLSLVGGFCAAGSFDSTASGLHEDAQTSQFSSDASSVVEMRSDQSMHCLSAEIQIMGTLLMDPVSPEDVQNPNMSLQTPTERFDNSIVTSPTGNVAEKSLEILSFSTPTELRAVQPFSGHKPVSPAKSSLCLIEADQIQANEEKDTVGNRLLEPKNAGSMVEGAASVCNGFDSEMKFENKLRESMRLVSCTGQEIVVLGAGAIPVREPNDLASSMEEISTDKCGQEMQTSSPAIEIEDGHSVQTRVMIQESDKCVKVQQFEATEQDGERLNVDSSSNGHKCLPISGSGCTGMPNWQSICHLQDLEGQDVKEEEKVGHNEPDMTAELPQEDKEEAEKDECKIENSDVSTEISFQTKNGSSTIARDEKASRVTVLVHDDKKSAEQCDLGPLVEPTFQSEEGEVKAELEAAIQTTAESIDAFACPVQTGTVLSQESGNTSTDLPISVCWKCSQSSQPMILSQGNAPAVHESRCSQLNTFQDEAEKKSAGKSVASDDHLVFREGNSGQTEGKAKCIPDEERGSVVDTAKELGTGLSCVNHISVERPITSLCTTTDAKCSPISSGNHSASIDLSSDPGLNDIGTKCNLTTSVQTMTLPDLNTTVNQLPALFQQPFTDSQQVQLRAQILTYGSLIQGSLPEESLMMAAFGDAGASCNDGVSTNCGGNLWEKSWHLAAAKIQGKVLCQTSEIMTSMTTHSMRPVLCSKISEEGMRNLGSPPSTVNVTDSSNSPVIGMRSVDLAATKIHSSRSRSVGSPNIGTVGLKNYPAVMMSLSYPLSSPSPVWGTSTPVHEGIQGSSVARNLHLDSYQVTPARHLYQTPHFGNYGSGSTSPWISNSPSPLPWVSSRATAEPGLPFSTFLVPEVNQEPLNNRSSLSSCVPYKSGMASAPSVTSVMMGTATTHAAANAKTDAQKGSMGVGRQSSIEQKSRKRKKSIRSEEIIRTGGLSQSGLATSATGVFVPLATSSAISSSGSLLVTPSNHAGAMPSSLLETGSSMPYDPSVSHYQIISRGEGKHTVIFSEETASCIEQAKLYADEAAFVAASAVKHSEAIWSQLGVHESSGLSSDHEAKLASSAVAAAAAASVAKAAAAAAKVAYEAALQAKLMAAEALTSDSTTRVNQFGEAGYLQVGREGQAIPNHVMKGRERDSTSSWQMSNSCHSKVVAAREVTKNMVSAVSAATKRAQNLAAIERAAGLAAEAVSQAGAVVAMGDPVPLMLNTLLKAGPDGYWRLENQMARTPGCLDNVQNEAQLPQKNATGNLEISLRMLESKENKEICKTEMPRKTKDVGKAPAEDSSSQRDEMRTQTSDDVRGSIISIRKDSKVQKGNNKGDAVETGLSVLEVEATLAEEDVVPDVEHDTKVQKEEFASKTNQIKYGSLVEVVSDEEGLQGVWFSAKVLSLKDGKALVCYDELLSDEGSVQLQEWIPLEEESGKAPRIRMAHPMTVIKFEGTRKRRRAAMGNHVWSVGDHADAWMRDGWWEGIVMGKSEEDESRVTVYFPGGGDTSIIKAWNLRPSLVWKDGQWVEWTSSGLGKEVAPEDELPSGKRQKVDKDDTGGEQKGRDKLQKIPNVEEGKKVHQLSAVISSIKDLKSSAGSAMNSKVHRSGLQNEGPRVVSRIPKPAKKRKFMDVSRHYATDTIRNSPGGKVTSKIDKGKAPLSYNQSGWKANKDKKQKTSMILKTKESKLGKRSQDEQNKAQTEKGRSFVANPTAIKKDILGHDLMLSGTPSINVDGSKTSRRMVVVGDVPLSACNEIVTRRPSPSIKAKAVWVGETELGSKGKQLGSSNISQNAEKNAKERDHGKTTDIIEPRRSNRRIQPTSKLLEGLQSSPKIMKSSLSSFSHEKGGKVQSKTSSLISKGPVSTRNVL